MHTYVNLDTKGIDLSRCPLLTPDLSIRDRRLARATEIGRFFCVTMHRVRSWLLRCSGFICVLQYANRGGAKRVAAAKR